MDQIVNSLSAYGPSNQLIDSDSITGIVGAGPYTLSVSGTGIYRVIIDGQIGGFSSEFDNLSVTPVPELSVRPVPAPATLPLLATGLGMMGWLAWRKKRKATAPKPSATRSGTA